MDSGQEYLACATLYVWTAYTLAGRRGQDPVFHNMMKSSIVHYGMLLSFTFPMGSMLWILPFWVLDRVST
jgi:hypothetical protein